MTSCYSRSYLHLFTFVLVKVRNQFFSSLRIRAEQDLVHVAG